MKLTSCSVAALLLLGGCCNDDFVMPVEDDYIDVTYLVEAADHCTSTPLYSTANAKAATVKPSCAQTNGNVYSARFKFQGPETTVGTIVVMVGPDVVFEYGTQQNTIVTVYDTDMTTELECNYADSYNPIYLYREDYTPGAYYYFTVSTPDEPSRGTFTLCVTDTD